MCSVRVLDVFILNAGTCVANLRLKKKKTQPLRFLTSYRWTTSALTALMKNATPASARCFFPSNFYLLYHCLKFMTTKPASARCFVLFLFFLNMCNFYVLNNFYVLEYIDDFIFIFIFILFTTACNS